MRQVAGTQINFYIFFQIDKSINQCNVSVTGINLEASATKNDESLNENNVNVKGLNASASYKEGGN